MPSMREAILFWLQLSSKVLIRSVKSVTSSTVSSKLWSTISIWKYPWGWVSFYSRHLRSQRSTGRSWCRRRGLIGRWEGGWGYRAYCMNYNEKTYKMISWEFSIVNDTIFLGLGLLNDHIVKKIMIFQVLFLFFFIPVHLLLTQQIIIINVFCLFFYGFSFDLWELLFINGFYSGFLGEKTLETLLRLLLAVNTVLFYVFLELLHVQILNLEDRKIQYFHFLILGQLLLDWFVLILHDLVEFGLKDKHLIINKIVGVTGF